MSLVDRIERALKRICNPTNRRGSTSSATNGKPQITQHDYVHPKDTTTGSISSTLCVNCSKLELRAMLEEETIEEDMGPLSEHLFDHCPLCNLISEAVRTQWGEGWGSCRLVAESESVPRVFIQSRSPVAVKEDQGHLEHPEPRLLLALDISPPGHTENRRVIREVDRVKDRHIIAEIESVPGDYNAGDHKRAHLVPRRVVEPSINYELVKTWLRDCKTHEHTIKAHKQMRQEAIDTGLFHSREGFRLIDVEQECLILKTEPCAFAALSYVWGRLPTILRPDEDSKEVPILLTTKRNLEQLSTPGGLKTANIEAMEGVRLPQTVVDAMEFSRRIGFRYLWIDTLCIVQDDKKDKSFLIKAMDDVYDIATVTYVAASGANADAGLCGVSPRSGRPMNSLTVIDDGVTEHLSLSPPSLGEEVRTSVWNTRGWTFQEQALSQRCLYFTNDELYFNCIELQWREAYELEHRDEIPDVQKIHVRTGPPWWNRKLRKDPDPTPYQYLGDLTGTLTIKDYQSAVQDYSRKTLTFPEDVLHAFEGVFNRFAKCSISKELSLEQTQGIPVNHLHRALLWFPSDEAQPRQCEKESEASFASWSWASWDGAIEFVFADSMWLSRNITQAPLKKVPIHALIPCWRYGETDKKFFSQDLWEMSCQPREGLGKDAAASCAKFLAYCEENIGVDTDTLLKQGVHGDSPDLLLGELGFLAAYVDKGDVNLEQKKGKVFGMHVGNHKGEFRFDAEGGEVDEYVAVVANDTITKPPDVVSIFLGLETGEDGVSRRVGVGWMYYSKGSEMPPWKYRSFRVA